MATRSWIGFDTGANIRFIYCHNDGYLEEVGRKLYDFYDRAKALELIELGSCSVLRPTIDECEFYHRDRRDPWDVCEPRELARTNFWNTTRSGLDIEYRYLLDQSGVWRCGSVHWDQGTSYPLGRKLTEANIPGFVEMDPVNAQLLQSPRRRRMIGA
jgi:hypothetical protein